MPSAGTREARAADTLARPGLGAHHTVSLHPILLCQRSRSNRWRGFATTHSRTAALLPLRTTFAVWHRL